MIHTSIDLVNATPDLGAVLLEQIGIALIMGRVPEGERYV